MKIEIIKGAENPVAEFFSSSSTPETDAAVLASEGQWSFVLKETCQRLERERDEAQIALTDISDSLGAAVADIAEMRKLIKSMQEICGK